MCQGRRLFRYPRSNDGNVDYQTTVSAKVKAEKYGEAHAVTAEFYHKNNQFQLRFHRNILLQEIAKDTNARLSLRSRFSCPIGLTDCCESEMCREEGSR